MVDSEGGNEEGRPPIDQALVHSTVSLFISFSAMISSFVATGKVFAFRMEQVSIPSGLNYIYLRRRSASLPIRLL